MERPLLFSAGMRTLRRLVVTALLLFAPSLAHAQDTTPPDGTRIATAQVSGIDLSRLSPGLQADIGKLVGASLDREALRTLVARIEAEQPRYVAALRVTADADGNARVFFVAARMRDAEQQADINAKYIVERVEIRGVKDDELTDEMRSDTQALTGKPLDSEVAERLETRLKATFTKYHISRQTSRGGQPGTIKVVFDLRRTEESRWLRFEPLDANAIYHSDQGWGARLPLTMSGDDFQVVPYFAIDVGDDLIEEYSGFATRFESRKIGTERLGVLFEWSTFDQTWRDQTILALPAYPRVPPLYRNRMTVSPIVKFAVTPQLTVGGGVSITELDDLNELSDDGQMANAGVGLVRFTQQWIQSPRARQYLGASFSVRAGTASLESDLVYERYLGDASYTFQWDRHRLFATGMFGRISGAAPLFERFSLGDSRTLRGWDKFDIAPVGGDRMFHTSIEYSYRMLDLFLDSGSVWDAGFEKKTRFAAGFGFSPGPAFFTVGFPLNTGEFRAVFTMGVRASLNARWR